MSAGAVVSEEEAGISEGNSRERAGCPLDNRSTFSTCAPADGLLVSPVVERACRRKPDFSSTNDFALTSTPRYGPIASTSFTDSRTSGSDS